MAIVGDNVFGGAARAQRPRGSAPTSWCTGTSTVAPAPVTFAAARVPVVTKGDPKAVVEASTTATFTVPGEYVLRAQITDESGESGGGDQCCWTTAHVKVTVK